MGCLMKGRHNIAKNMGRFFIVSLVGEVSQAETREILDKLSVTIILEKLCSSIPRKSLQGNRGDVPPFGRPV